MYKRNQYDSVLLIMCSVLFLTYCNQNSQLEPIEGLSSLYKIAFKNIQGTCQTDDLSMLSSNVEKKVVIGRKRDYIYIRQTNTEDPWQFKGSLCRPKGKVEAICLIFYQTKAYTPYDSLQDQVCILQHNVPTQMSIDTRPNAKNTRSCCDLALLNTPTLANSSDDSEQSEQSEQSDTEYQEANSSQAMILYNDDNQGFSGLMRGELFINVERIRAMNTLESEKEAERQQIACYGPLHCQYEAFIVMTPDR
jgi:hypothetical protein